MTTGIYFSKYFIGRNWPIVGDRYRNFSEMLSKLSSELHNIRVIEPKPVSEEILLKVHTKEYLDYVRRQWFYEGARITVGGCIDACEKVWKGEFDDAIVFLVAAGHHTHRDYGWGGTYLSCIGPILIRLRELGVRRIAYLDTDCHHGDGDREILLGDDDVLHICFCGYGRTDNETKLCVDVGFKTTDEEYLNKVKNTFPIIENFNPQMIIHFFGHDTHRDDYGSKGLTEDFFIDLARIIKDLSIEVCNGKYVIIDGGGMNRRVGMYIWERIIRLLASYQK